MKLKHLVASAIPTLFLGSVLAPTAHAVQQPAEVSERPLETAAGAGATRVAKTVGYRAPRKAQPAWQSFLAQRGSWRAIWDADTGVPSSIYGEGVDAPGSVADGAVAEVLARAMLTEQIGLLAPGANSADFLLEVNQVRAGIRQVRFAQQWRGMAVVGARVSFTFAHDRLVAMGSSAAPAVAAALPATMVSRGTAAASARIWIDDLYAANARALGTADAVVLPIVHGGSVTYRVVVPVVIDQAAPRAQWTVYVDAASGAPVARTQSLLFASGTVKFHVPVRHPGGDFEDSVAAFGIHRVDGVDSTADLAGLVSWTGAGTATLVPGLIGPRVRIQNAAGAIATTSLSIDPDGTTIWDEAADGGRDAQLTGFIRINEAKQFTIDTLDPDLALLQQRMDVNINVDGVCNAFYDPGQRSLNFFPAGSNGQINCGNTGELADVMRHEFGHALHHMAFGNDSFDRALSEGISDYLAATMANDAAMGLGFFADNPGVGLRHIDPEGIEKSWPQDVSEFDVHSTGEIIGGALWDLRKAAVAQLGESAGVALADDIFYGIISRASDIPDSYVEALVTDDDDGNLSNGTPHDCMISQTFGMHGLGDAESLPTVAPPAVDGLTLTLDQLPVIGGDCPGPQITGATVDWQLRDDASVNGTVAFAEGGTTFTATLPDQTAGEVIQYQVQAALDNGGSSTFPQNAADPWYEVFAGSVTEIFCTDFEADPTADGWALDGFQWGAPVGNAGSNDPTEAFSGASVIGINLNGDYSPGQTFSAVSPEIDVSGFDNVRLQYRRWLGAEDATYDPATITVDGTQLWANAIADGFLQHVDREWRFHDVDLAAQAADGAVTVTYGLTSDGGVEFGGWTVDAFCIVSVGAAGPSCGDGAVDDDEECDDGNDVDGDGCSAACVDETGGGGGGCCSTGGSGPAGSLLLGLGLAAVAVRRRRKRA